MFKKTCKLVSLAFCLFVLAGLSVHFVHYMNQPSKPAQTLEESWAKFCDAMDQAVHGGKYANK